MRGQKARGSPEKKKDNGSEMLRDAGCKIETGLGGGAARGPHAGVTSDQPPSLRT